MTTAHKLLTTTLTTVVGALLSPCAAVAQEPGQVVDHRWTLRAHGFFMSTGGAPTIESPAGATLASDNDNAAGGGVRAEYRLTRRVGLELETWIADHGDFRATGASGVSLEATDTMTNIAVGMALNYHLTPGSMADLHAGAVLTSIAYDDLVIVDSAPGSDTTTKVSFDRDLAFGLHLGVDLGLPDSNWILYADLRVLSSTLDGSVTGGRLESVGYDPVLLSLGFGYRF